MKGKGRGGEEGKTREDHEREVERGGVSVRDGHGGGWSRKINAWHLYTLMVYL